MPTNEILPFCPVDTGTNLLNEADYTAAADRTDGNQPGVASSKLNNKALRQGTYLAAGLSQFLVDNLGSDVLDNNTPGQLLSQMKASLLVLPPVVSTFTSGSGTYSLPYYFFIASGNATIGATYTNNGATFTVSATISSGIMLKTTGSGAPSITGTLTKSGGTGDSSLTFYAIRAPTYLEVLAVGAGAGGASSTGSGNTGTNGGNTTFGTSLITANGGVAPTFAGFYGIGGVGGTGTIVSPALGTVTAGGAGASTSGQGFTPGGVGGNSILGGAGGGGIGFSSPTAGTNAATNSGSGGGGGGVDVSGGGGAGGGAGAGIRAIINSPSPTYGYVIGAKGTGGTGGQQLGADAGDGIVQVVAHFQ